MNNEYLCILDGNSLGHFSIDQSTGKLSCVALDREDVPSYTLTIMARDLGSSSHSSQVRLQLTVLDENDGTPSFSANLYEKRIKEDVAIGTMVLLVSAMDRDEGENGRITYSLGNDTDGLFTVDIGSGNITTTGYVFFDKNGVKN